MSKLTLKTEGNTHVVVTRRFAAPPEAVYRAHTDPKLIQKWLLGPEGWTMPVCINDARPGGKMRYECSKYRGRDFNQSGGEPSPIGKVRVARHSGAIADMTAGTTSPAKRLRV
jgi:Activator of Hsp90 ATPase homolog 1-like protein